MSSWCPSMGWDEYCEAEERRSTPTNAEMLDTLDAYGHLTWTAGICENCEDHDWDFLVCVDFKVFDCPNRGLLIAYHVVYNSESGGFIDTLESVVAPVEKAPFGILMDHFCSAFDANMEGPTEGEYKDAEKMSAAFDKSMRDEIARAQKIVDELGSFPYED